MTLLSNIADGVPARQHLSPCEASNSKTELHLNKLLAKRASWEPPNSLDYYSL